MTANLELIASGGRCPVCFRTDVRSLEAVIRNCDSTLVALVGDYAHQKGAALVLSAATLKSTAADLRCCLGICKSPLY